MRRAAEQGDELSPIPSRREKLFKNCSHSESNCTNCLHLFSHRNVGKRGPTR
jgi:hypothetical protein